MTETKTVYQPPQPLLFEVAGPPPGLNLKQRVAYILTMYPETRDNDNLLVLHYWLTFDRLHSLLDQETLARLTDWIADATNPETIRRRRQEIQQLDTQAGDLQPSANVANYRRGRAHAGPPRR